MIVPRVLTVPKHSQYAPSNTWSMKYTSTVCTPCRQFSGPVFGTNHSQMVRRVGVGANYFRWGQLEYLKHWQYFGNMYREEYVLRVLSVSRCSPYSTLILPWAPRNAYCGNTVWVLCWSLLSRSQSITSQPRPRTTFLLTFKVQAWNWSPRVTCSGSISTYPNTLFYIIVVVMIPHYFHKQRYT